MTAKTARPRGDRRRFLKPVGLSVASVASANAAFGEMVRDRSQTPVGSHPSEKPELTSHAFTG